jgi:hypothetical protein
MLNFHNTATPPEVFEYLNSLNKTWYKTSHRAVSKKSTK